MYSQVEAGGLKPKKPIAHWTSSICLGQIENTSNIEFKVELLLVTGLYCFGGSSCTSIAFDNDMQLS